MASGCHHELACTGRRHALWRAREERLDGKIMGFVSTPANHATGGAGTGSLTMGFWPSMCKACARRVVEVREIFWGGGRRERDFRASPVDVRGPSDDAWRVSWRRVWGSRLQSIKGGGYGGGERRHQQASIHKHTLIDSNTISQSSTPTSSVNIIDLDTTNPTNYQNDKLPQLGCRPRKGPPRERQRRLQRLLHWLAPRLATSLALCIPQLVHGKPFIQPQEPNQPFQGVEGLQEAPRGDERRLCRLLQSKQLSPRLAQHVCRLQPQAQCRGPEQVACCRPHSAASGRAGSPQLPEGVAGLQEQGCRAPPQHQCRF